MQQTPGCKMFVLTPGSYFTSKADDSLRRENFVVKTKWKVLIGVLVIAVLGIGVYASTVYSKKGLVTVQTGSVVRQDLTSLVTASGEIKPKNYINIGAKAQGEIREVLVKEAERVRKGQLLGRIETVQPQTH